MAYETITYELELEDSEGMRCKMEAEQDGTASLVFVGNATYTGAEIGVLIEWLLRVAEEVGEYEV